MKLIALNLLLRINVNGSEWLASLPEKSGPERDQKILEAVSSGLAYCNWLPITSQISGHQATFYVCDDAVRVDLEDGSRFRMQVHATLSQKCADIMEASLVTAKINDLTYKQAQVVLNATILLPVSMTTTSKSKKYNELLEKKRGGQTGLIRDCGKAWIVSNSLGKSANVAVNYGFYDPKALYKNPVGIRLWQNVGTRHDRYHTDYSQTLILMDKKCEVDGQKMNVIDVMKSPELCELLSYEGVLKFTRQPGA